MPSWWNSKQGVLVYWPRRNNRQTGVSGEQSGKPLPIKSDIGQNHHANSRGRARLVGGHCTTSPW